MDVEDRLIFCRNFEVEKRFDEVDQMDNVASSRQGE